MELKFRAWDHVNKVMLFADFGELQDIDGDWTAWDLPRDSPTNTGTAFEVLPFTGLLDDKKVSVYAGDIVYSSGNKSKYEVKFGTHSLTGLYYDCDACDDIECTGFYLLRLGEYDGDIEAIDSDSIKYLSVIGNIHQEVKS